MDDLSTGISYSKRLEFLIEDAYQERVKYKFIMKTIDINTDLGKSMTNHALDFARDIEQLQEFKAKVLGALTTRGLLHPIPATV